MEKWLKLFDTCTQISTDSRNISEGCMYIALKGANFNGNEFAASAIENGAKYAIVDQKEYITNENILYVEDGLSFLQDLAHAHRLRFDIPVIGITGSNGKTSTKELVKCCLEKKFNVLCTEGNLNNHIGVPLTLLKLKPVHEIAIIEMGANKMLDIDELSRIAKPTHGLITNIGKAHLEGFINFQGVLKTKTELYNHVVANKGCLFVNADDPILLMEATKRTSNILTFGQQDAQINGNLLKLDPYVHFSWRQNKYNSRHIKTNMVGKYNFYNFLAALCIGSFFNVDNEQLNEAIEAYWPDNNRSQVHQTKRNTLILDCYNANPTSMFSALSSFVEIAHQDKLAILGDMLELGQDGPEEHQKIVDYLKQHQIDFITVGSIFKKINPQGFQQTNDLMSAINLAQIENKLILLKGSRAIALEQLIESL